MDKIISPESCCARNEPTRYDVQLLFPVSTADALWVTIGDHLSSINKFFQNDGNHLNDDPPLIVSSVANTFEHLIAVASDKFSVAKF